MVVEGKECVVVVSIVWVQQQTIPPGQCLPCTLSFLTRWVRFNGEFLASFKFTADRFTLGVRCRQP